MARARSRRPPAAAPVPRVTSARPWAASGPGVDVSRASPPRGGRSKIVVGYPRYAGVALPSREIALDRWPVGRATARPTGQRSRPRMAEFCERVAAWTGKDPRHCATRVYARVSYHDHERRVRRWSRCQCRRARRHGRRGCCRAARPGSRRTPPRVRPRVFITNGP